MVIVFNVGRGLAVFIRMPNNKCIIYDMGSSEDFSPAKVIKEKFIDTGYIKGVSQLFVSHPHKDHFQESDNMLSGIKAKLGIDLITMPNFKDFKNGEGEGRKDEKLDESFLSQQMKDEDLNAYKRIYGDRQPPLVVTSQPVTSAKEDIQSGLFYMRPPDVKGIHGASVQHYGNGTSLCFYYRHNSHAIWLQGDVTPEVMKQMLNASSDELERRFAALAVSDVLSQCAAYSYSPSESGKNPYPADVLSRSNLKLVNIASHHGLESGYCEEFFDVVTPIVNIISESSTNIGNVDARYSKNAEGIYVHSGKHFFRDNQKRYSLTTRQDGHILIVMGKGTSQPIIYHSKDVEEILSAMNNYAY